MFVYIIDYMDNTALYYINVISRCTLRVFLDVNSALDLYCESKGVVRVRVFRACSPLAHSVPFFISSKKMGHYGFAFFSHYIYSCNYIDMVRYI